MANYQEVLWQEDDDLTSEKFKRMADNDDFFNTNVMIPYGFHPAVVDNPIGDYPKFQYGVTDFQLGWTGSPAAEGVATITFPKPFPHGVNVIFLQGGNVFPSAGADTILTVVWDHVTLSNFELHARSTDNVDISRSAGKCMWMAIGW